MKIESKEAVQEKEFDTVKTFRAIKDKISLELADMNFEQIKEYLKTNSTKLYTNSKPYKSSIGNMPEDGTNSA